VPFYRQVAIGIKFTQCVSGQKSTFSPLQENYVLDRKMIPPFRIVMAFSISVQILGDIELCVPTVGAKIGAFCMSRLVCLCVGGSSNKYCVTVYGSILMRCSALFQNGWLFQMHYLVLIIVARWRHTFCEIAVKNCEKSKNLRKSLCAPLRTSLRKDSIANYASIWTLFSTSVTGPDIL